MITRKPFTTLETAVGDVQVRTAATDDLVTVMAILGEAAGWLEEKGIRQWPNPPNEHWWRRTAGYVGNGEVYLAYTSAEAIGTLRIAWSDPYWPDDGGKAGYVHSLAIREQARGLGVGLALMTRALEQIRQQGKVYARLDCQATNKHLRRYYEGVGFTFRGPVSDRDYTTALYELLLE